MHNLFEKASNLRCTLKRRQPRNTLMFFLLQWENKDARQSTTCQLLLDDLPSNYCETKLFRENSYSNCFNCMIAFLVGKYWVSAKTQKFFTNPWKWTDNRLSQCIALSTTETTFQKESRVLQPSGKWQAWLTLKWIISL